MFSQLTDNPVAPGPSAGQVRLGAQGQRLRFDVAAATGDPRQVLLWDRQAYLHGPLADAVTQETDGGPGQDSQHGEIDPSGRWLVVESAADPVGLNAEGNAEIFLLDTKKGLWTQITDTRAPEENRRRNITLGSRITFDTTGAVDSDPRTNINNRDGNSEIFQARKKRGGGFVITQLTDTQAPVDNRHGATRNGGNTVLFSSNGDLNTDPLTAASNRDHNREIFSWDKSRGGVITQLTDSIGGENVIQVVSPLGRYVVFESTADLLGDGAQNRRVFQLDRWMGKLRSLSRSRFGDNFSPRTSARLVVWESTADLTGHNPTGKRVIYLLDRRKAEQKP